MKTIILKAFLSTLLLVLSTGLQAANSVVTPQPTTCIASTWTSTGNQWSRNIALQLKNNCTQAVDFQNVMITFKNSISLNTNFWGDFSPLAYPDNQTTITATKQSDGSYLATLNLHFPTYQGAVTTLPVGKSITIRYTASQEGHSGNANVYLAAGGGPVTETGTITVKNASAKPANVSQTYALVHLRFNGATVSDMQVPWSGSQSAAGLAAGTYTLAADNVSDSAGLAYQGTVTPSSINLSGSQTVTATVTYAAITQPGKLAIQLQALPTQLAGYTAKPTVVVSQSGTSSSTSVSVSWGASNPVTQLKDGASYNFSTPVITYNGYNCTPAFAPATLAASSSTTPVTNLSYTCASVPQNNATINVSGAPSSLSSLKITLTPNNNSTAVTSTISLSNGSGSSTVQLTNGVSYTVSGDSVSGYSASFSPQPLASAANATETIKFTQGTNPVAVNGQLTVCGTKLCNQSQQPIQLKGMSTHGLQWYGWGVCITGPALDKMVSWGANVIRISMYVQEGGYETNPTKFTQQVNTIIDEATKRGMYAIVDFHILTPGDPNANLANAKKFFTDIATAHKNNVNLLYEIANEPNGVTWAQIKSYAETIIPVIRAIDTHNPIIVGTTGWSSLGVSEGNGPQEIISNQVKASNILYAFHFYAASHQAPYLSALDTASNSIPVFVTEFGEQNYSGEGANDLAYTDKYMALMAQKKIGWTNWNWADDYRSGSIWNTGACSANTWPDSSLKESGTYIKTKIATP